MQTTPGMSQWSNNENIIKRKLSICSIIKNKASVLLCSSTSPNFTRRSTKILMAAITLGKYYCTITDEDIRVIILAKNPILYHDFIL